MRELTDSNKQGACNNRGGLQFSFARGAIRPYVKVIINMRTPPLPIRSRSAGVTTE